MLKIMKERQYAEIFMLGIISGMPLAIIFSTLAAWLKESGVALEVITTFAIARIPYSLKFLWAPFVDYIKIPKLNIIGHRKSWLLICAILMTIILFLMSYANPAKELGLLYTLTIMLGICSATFDISVDALRIEKFCQDMQGTAAANAVFGYRVGMLITGAGALLIASNTNSWPQTFKILSFIFFIFTLVIFRVEEKEIIRTKINNLSVKNIGQMIISPFKDFLVREGAILILAVVILFKMGDAILGVVSMPFYLELGFSKQQIAIVVKGYGLAATIAGSYLGGLAIDRLGPYKGLIITGLIQSLTHFAFIWLANQPNNYQALLTAITIENLGAGMGSSALVAYLSMLCNKNYSATQYALLSSAASFFTNTIAIPAGGLVKTMGWYNYFIFTIILALPAILLLIYLNKKFKNNVTDSISS